MKTIKFLSYSLFVLFLSISISSCSGDDGADGSNGTDGATGLTGADGNANVFASDWYDITWNNTNTTFAFHDQAADEITQENTDSSVVLVYVKFGDFIYNTPVAWNETCTIGSFFQVENVRVYFYSETNISIPDLMGRYVIIPASNVAARGIINNSTPKQQVHDELENVGIDINDYYAVCEYYGINPK